MSEHHPVNDPYVIVVHKPTGRAFSMNRHYTVLDHDLGIYKPENWVEDWDGWLTFDHPEWVSKLGYFKLIAKDFHAYWLY